MSAGEEIVLYVGELASNLLHSPQYKMIQNLFEQQVAHDVLTTKPDQAPERERLYSQLQGMRAFHHHVAVLAEQYRSRTEIEAVDPDDLIDDPSVHDF